jgi:hypothetical protein
LSSPGRDCNDGPPSYVTTVTTTEHQLHRGGPPRPRASASASSSQTSSTPWQGMPAAEMVEPPGGRQRPRRSSHPARSPNRIHGPRASARKDQVRRERRHRPTPAARSPRSRPIRRRRRGDGRRSRPHAHRRLPRENRRTGYPPLTGDSATFARTRVPNADAATDGPADTPETSADLHTHLPPHASACPGPTPVVFQRTRRRADSCQRT